VQFKYGEDLGDDGVTEECFKLIRKEITALHVMLRDASASTPLSQHNLLEFLHYSDSLESAIVLEDTVKEIWKAHEDETMRQRLDDGILDLLRGKRERALTAFLGIVKDDPLYAEAWNKISTCQYMMGDMGASMDSATKALELLPTHFQALAGLGLIQCETRRYKLATESFRRSLYLDPWSPVSARQSVCLDVLRGLDQEERIWSKEEEQGAAEGTAPYH
jgi:tetratricopeptide (TPR) repeat protein